MFVGDDHVNARGALLLSGVPRGKGGGRSSEKDAPLM